MNGTEYIRASKSTSTERVYDTTYTGHKDSILGRMYITITLDRTTGMLSSVIDYSENGIDVEHGSTASHQDTMTWMHNNNMELVSY